MHAHCPARSLFRARLRRHEARHAVVDDELPVMLAGVLDQAPGEIRKSDLLVGERINVQLAHSAVALALDERRAVREGLLDVRDHVGLGLEVGGLGSPDGIFAPITGLMK